MRQIIGLAAIALAALALSAPAAARVHEESADSFVIRLGVVVPVDPEKAWDMLIQPSQWWNEANTFSGDAANLSLLARAGGCFCEILPNKDSPDGAPRGSVEHMRVVYAEDGRALRMVGALGPLQSDAVTGVLTIVLNPSDAGTQILWEYAVSGHLRKPDMAAMTDRLLTGQILRLAEKLGARQDSSGEAGEAGEGKEALPEGEGASVDDSGADNGHDEASDVGPDAEAKSESAPPDSDEATSSIIGR